MWKLVVLQTFRKYMLPTSSRLILYSTNRMVFVTETQKLSSVFNYNFEECRTANGRFAVFSRGCDQGQQDVGLWSQESSLCRSVQWRTRNKWLGLSHSRKILLCVAITSTHENFFFYQIYKELQAIFHN
jgi:hypothetical protein